MITSLSLGGAERFLLDLTREISKDDFDVQIGILIPDYAALEVFKSRTPPIHLFDFRGGHKLKSIPTLRRFISEYAPDIIHAHMYHGLVASILGLSIPKQVLCFTSHCGPQAFPPARAALVRGSRWLRNADIIFSEGQHPHLNVRNTLVIGNGVSVPEAAPIRKSWRNADLIRLIAVGRLADQKAPLELIRSIATLDDPRIQLDWFGIGELERDCRELIRALKLESRVRLRGVSNEIRSEMRNADIFVMRSKFEGMPIALLEAGAEAMPVISTPAGSVPDLLGSGRGVIAEPPSFTEALCAVIDDPETSLDQGRRLFAYVRDKHSIEGAARAHEALYRSLMRRFHERERDRH